MGVPGFFAWLIKNYNRQDIIQEKLNDELINKVNTLYIDANCLFHPQCFKVLEHYDKLTDVYKLEGKMITRILNYMDYLIDYANPSKYVHISVDGVAPMAKMSQQRKRRFRSIDDNVAKEEIKKKYGKKVNTSWNNTVITPGTEFMERLHLSIIKYVKNRKRRMGKGRGKGRGIDIIHNPIIIYSSYHVPGEGEHKILQHIKSREDKNELYTIYGLDADLIFLSLATQRKNIYLLREAIHFGTNKDDDMLAKTDKDISDVGEVLNYVSIDNLKDCIRNKIGDILDAKNEDRDKYLFNNSDDKEDVGEDNINIDEKHLDKEFLTNDYIFLCYLLGNDFLPHLPSIDIRIGGLDFLIDCYSDIYNTLDAPLVNYDQNKKKVDINSIFLDMLFRKISQKEDYYFREIMPKYFRNLERRKCQSSDPCDIELWNLENMKGFDVEDTIKLGIDHKLDWKFRYYEHYFGASEFQNELIFSMVKEYMCGLIWVAKYYFEECPSWYWQYPYSHAPFVSNISQLFNKFKLNSFKFDKSKPISPCVQLLAVLPPACSNILPQSYRYLVSSKNSPIIDMYPQRVELDLLYKDSYFKCIPHIPNVEIERLLKCVNSVELTTDEHRRNAILKDIKN